MTKLKYCILVHFINCDIILGDNRVKILSVDKEIKRE